jgi:predicted GNAT family acetyltransferase
MTDAAVADNPALNRYELPVQGLVAHVAYNLAPPNLMITEVVTPKALEGRGIASRMAAHVVEDARARGLLILPVCPFFAAWLKKHPEHADVVHPSYRNSLGL